MFREESSFSRIPNWPWQVLLAVYLLLAVTYSIIQPLGRTPDEAAHVTYVKFIADNWTLPIWQAAGGGEAGYEAQHPPLYYGVMAVVHKLAGGLSEEWRWQVMRWFTILLTGLPVFFMSKTFFRELWGEHNWYAFIATATVMLMPMTLLYTAYINPDAMVMVWTTATLWMAWRVRVARTASGLEAPPTETGSPTGDAPRGSRAYRDAALLGLLAGLATLSKLSGAPALALAMVAHVWMTGGTPVLPRKLAVAWKDLAITIAVFALTCGWWFARNVFYYGTAFIHTTGMMGTGAEAAARFGFWSFAKLTWRETYLSSWVQRGWFPVGFWTGLLYGIIIVMTVAAVVGLVRGRMKRSAGPVAHDATPTDSVAEPSDYSDVAAERVALNYSGLLLGLVFLGQQWAFWTVDVEFNAGGRYILVGMMGLSLLLIAGVRKLLQHWSLPVLWGWLISLLVMNQVSIWCIWTILNPRYAPNWEIFHFPR